MNKSIVYVIATPHAEGSVEFNKTPAFSFIQDFKDCAVDVHYSNTKGLSSIYNTYITPKYKDYYVVFLHHDVEIHDFYINRKVRDNLNRYNIVGLAGCKSIENVSQPEAWHLLSSERSYLGEVAHTHAGRIWTSKFGPTEGRALLLDGLFIGVDVEALLKYNIKFDEEFKFHHYDLSFCLRANQQGATLGTMQLFCIHHGLGDSMNTIQWRESAGTFRRKYLQ